LIFVFGLVDLGTFRHIHRPRISSQGM